MNEKGIRLFQECKQTHQGEREPFSFIIAVEWEKWPKKLQEIKTAMNLNLTPYKLRPSETPL